MELQEQIKINIAEHDLIINQLATDMEKLRLEMIELQKDPAKRKELVMKTMMRVTLEMKQAFHRGAIAALKDLKV